ncbi:sensor histidine kinase [Gorillibacterium sp. sgz5001074]|uniref:sensor histidine kinase n=1 Tax=Gorillibacterium sp. sgz5001074 TaxID=3446695 RepID=UPI003F672F11
MIDSFAAALKRLLVPRSLRRQLLSRSLTILAVILVLIGTLQYWFMKDFAYRNKAETLKSQISTFPKDLFGYDSDRRMEEPGSGNPRQEPNGGMNRGEPPGGGREEGYRGKRPFIFLPDIAIAAIDAAGTQTVISVDNTLQPPKLTAEEYQTILDQLNRRAEPDYRIASNADGVEQLVVFRSIGGPEHPAAGFIQISTPTEALQDVLFQQLFLFLGLSSFALLAGLFLSMPVVRRTLVPLSNIGNAVQQIDAGNLSQRLPVCQGQEEVDRLSLSFNGMLERLETSFQVEREAKEQMRRFAADASHELRTPLTSIHGFLEILLRGAADKPDQLYRALNSMYGESKRINKLVEDLLLLAKMDREPQLLFKKAALKDVLQEMEHQLRMLADTRSVGFYLGEPCQGRFDTDKMKQVILNLFHNAVQHTPAEGGAITLKLERAGDDAVLTVMDNGSGISDEHLPHVFDRFYRSESSRTRRSGGAGLGLSITKSIVEAHGGTIRVESKPGDGTSFIIRVPLVGNDPG